MTHEFKKPIIKKAKIGIDYFWKAMTGSPYPEKNRNIEVILSVRHTCLRDVFQKHSELLQDAVEQFEKILPLAHTSPIKFPEYVDKLSQVLLAEIEADKSYSNEAIKLACDSENPIVSDAVELDLPNKVIGPHRAYLIKSLMELNLTVCKTSLSLTKLTLDALDYMRLHVNDSCGSMALNNPKALLPKSIKEVSTFAYEKLAKGKLSEAFEKSYFLRRDDVRVEIIAKAAEAGFDYTKAPSLRAA